MKKKVIVLGAGISGLATAYWLFKDNIDCTVLERSGEVGGTIVAEVHESYLFDRGPNSGLETTPLIRKLAEETGISDQMIYGDERSDKRYILRNNTLHPLPKGPLSFLTTRLFSTGAKLRLLAEPFIGRSEDGYYQSIAEFVRRRLGREFLDYAINPFVAGVFAGNPEKLSVMSAFPKLYHMEEEYGGLIKGMIRGAGKRKKDPATSKQKAKMFSFRDGMQTLPKAIAGKLEDRVIVRAHVQSVSKRPAGFAVSYTKNGNHHQIDGETVVTTIPAYAAENILRGLDHELAQHLSAIYYPPVLVIYVVYRKEAVGRKLDGLGYLIPEKEQKHYLGALWSSTIFPNRADDLSASFTIFAGGARSPELFERDETTVREKILDEFQNCMKISEPPVYITQKKWEKAIPQYEIGYIEHERYFQNFENKFPGIFIGGNFRGGISIGDCIKNSETLADKVKKHLGN